LDIYISKESSFKVNEVMFDEIAITSSFKLHILDENSQGFSIDDIENVKVQASKVGGQKCQRCWKYEKELIKNEICNRCIDAIS
jgi:Isoleucyl-tRNA synthetase